MKNVYGATVLSPKGFSRLGLIRRWYHQHVLRHGVSSTLVRDFTGRRNRRAFYYRRGWMCLNCRALWP